MKIFFSVAAMILCLSSFAQTITYETVDITNPENTDWPSKYPIFKSTTKPQAAEIINMALQISDFQMCNTKKNPKAVKADMDHAWNFTVTRPSSRLIEVTTIRKTLAFGMQIGPYDDVFVYHFDAETGDRLYPYSFFKNRMFTPTQETAINQLMKIMKKRKQQLLIEHSDMDPKELFEDGYDETCKQQMLNEWENETVRINFKKDSIVFIVNDCDNGIPRRNHEVYGAAVSVNMLQYYLGPVYYYYLMNGPKPAIDYADHIWRGTIGTNIPVTIMLHCILGGPGLEGYEVYDNHGIAIAVSGDLMAKNPYLEELQDKKTIATYFMELKGYELTGEWIKEDRSKRLPVKLTLPH